LYTGGELAGAGEAPVVKSLPVDVDAVTAALIVRIASRTLIGVTLDDIAAAERLEEESRRSTLVSDG
jgi:hypothetical protein